MSPKYITILKFSSVIASLFLFKISPISLITRSAGVEVPCTDKYFLASLAMSGYLLLLSCHQDPVHSLALMGSS